MNLQDTSNSQNRAPIFVSIYNESARILEIQYERSVKRMK